MMKWSGHILDPDKRTHIMGILNVTPDSFSDGGSYFRIDKAIQHGLDMAGDGADIIDVGGESTRPYSQKLSVKEELDRVLPVIQALDQKLKIPISIDTYKAEVAGQALLAGASMINDISALRFDKQMVSVAAEAGIPVILMHMKGTPTDMQENPEYSNLVSEIITFLQEAIDRGIKGGINRDMIIVDPGIGFGKTFDHNLEIINKLDQLKTLKTLILLGTSRKAFIGHILENKANERDTGTMATVAAGVLKGAHIVRVHNVKKALETVKIIDAVKDK